MLYRFGDCSHQPVGFVIFAQHAQLRIFFIFILLLPIQPIIGTCKIAQTLYDAVNISSNVVFRLWGCQSCLFSISHIFQLLLNCCLCIFNSFSCHSGFTIHIILDPFLLLFIAHQAGFLSLPRCKLLIGLQAVHCLKASDPFCFQAALAVICLMMWSCGVHCQITIFACQ